MLCIAFEHGYTNKTVTQFKLVFQSIWGLFPFPIGPFPIFMGFLQLYYLYEVFATNDTGGVSFSFVGIFSILWSLLTVVLTFQIFANVAAKRWVGIFLSALGLTVYSVSAAYTFGSHDSLRWNVLVENLSIAFTPESLNVLFHSLDAKGLQYGGIILVIFGVLEWRYNTVSKIMPSVISWKKRCVGFLLYFLMIILPIEAMDPLLKFVRSVYFYYASDQVVKVHLSDNEYPFLRTSPPRDAINIQEKPMHVFLIIVESLNADVVGAMDPSGRAYTPYLNQLKSTSVVVDRFYGNSIQTAKGHFGLLFSFIPSLKGKVFVKYPDIRIKSIASVLSDNGYESIAFSAYHNRNFDNTTSFFLTHGYDEYETVRSYLTPKDFDDRLDWGVKDEVYFKRFFEYFDQRSSNAPTFYTLMTIANHFPFNSMKPKDKLIYPSPQDIHENYANSVHLVDRGIARFYEELKKRGLFENSLVIITSDHAFPMGAHGNYHLESGYHEDSFRIPFFMTWPAKLAPQTIKKVASQMDVAPTILDLLSISEESSNFQGGSIFDGSSAPIFLVQPYAKHFSVVRFPYKYRFFEDTQKEYVYDLVADPFEKNSIIQDVPTILIEQFRSDLKTMYQSQFALERNQVRPLLLD